MSHERKTVLNLTSYELNEHQLYLFYLSKSFSPTPTMINYPQFETDWRNFTYTLRYKYKFTMIEKTQTEEDKPPPRSAMEIALVKNNHVFPIINSGCPALELFIQKCNEDIITEQQFPKNIQKNLTDDQQKALKDLKNLEKDYNIIIRPYDKGVRLVLKDRDSYRTDVEKDLNSDTFETIPEDQGTINRCVNAIKEWVNKWRDKEELLTKKVCDWILPDIKNKPGNNYHNIKRHKENYPGRLISTGCGTYIENLSKLTAYEMKKCYNNLKWCIKDVNHFLRLIDETNTTDFINQHEDIIHVSWDVVSMFPSIPEDIGMSECTALLNERDEGLSTECVIEGLQITLNNNLTQFNDVMYRQAKGAGMGPNNSCEYGDMAMNHFDKLINSEDAPYKLNLWARFRDDTYEPWTHGEEALHTFTTWMNTLSPSIKFTVKYSREGIEFLNTFVYTNNGRLQTKIYSKPSDTHCYLTPNSCHPYHTVKKQKVGKPETQIRM